ncbi:DNA polymerase III subunit beta [Dyadobacter sp. CY261]|uniref:DNA polymerase III subunit beta n=1 Tax=Dyadobacter sp. CY261 TaxID=2907203 RepID=UPI001F2119FA|nr:DNA polymerase III subunit beta [Dyadobacter sp. CY261]MCF0074011.1 DNA polymerase III subunit beta [Dyadobacter sp. CY261]
MVAEQIVIGGSVETADLKRALNLFTKVVRDSPILPILDNVLFHFELGTLHLTASNLVTTVFTSIQEVDFCKAGSFLLPYRRIKALVSLSPAGKMVFQAIGTEEDDIEVAITTEYGEFRFGGLDKVGDYPALSWSPVSHFRINMSELREGLLLTRKTVSTDDLRPGMTGIHFDIAEGNIKLVSTDGHRLTKYETTAPVCETILPFTLPANFADFLLHSTSLKDKEVSFGLKGINVVVRFESCVVLSRAIDTFFPDYKAAMPSKFEHEVELDIAQVKARIQIGILFSNRTTSQMAFNFSQGKLSLESEYFDYGLKSKQSINVDQSAPNIKIGFNARFITTILAPFSGTVKLQMSAPNRPAVFVPQAKHAKSVQLLLMPVMLGHPYQ